MALPGGAIVGSVIIVDGVAAGVLSAPVDASGLPDRPRFSAFGVWSVIYGLRCTVKLASLWSLIDRLRCNKIFTLP